MLIKTKLQIPPLRPGMVNRRRLVEILNTGRKSRLLLITGQAGSGKTSLACQWVNGIGLKVAWYTVDESDNEGDLFFRYLLTALADHDPQFAMTLAPLLQSAKRLTIDDILSPLVDCSATGSSPDYYMVLDDYHLVSSGEIHEAVSSLLHYIPSNVHLVLIGRHEPPFSLAALMVHDQVARISATDLKFTEQEGEEFLSGTMGLTLTADQVRDFSSRAEGWVGGLQLLGLSCRHAEKPTDLSHILGSASRATAQYLLDEAIDLQPERTRSFLQRTVLLNRFNADLCRTITGIEETEAILQHLHSINLFLIPLDPDHHWYRYHHLFSESIRARIRGDDPQMARRTHREAAMWFARNNYLEDAFQHAFASEDLEFAADLMEDYLYLLLERYANANVQRWLSKLPYGIFMQRPLLRLDECSLKVLSQDLDDVQAVLANLESHRPEAEGRYSGIKRTRFRNTVAYLRYTLPYHRDPAEVDIDALKKGIFEIPRDENLSGATIDGTLVWCCLYQGDLLSAEATLEESRQEILSSKSIFRKAMWFKALADVERWSGRLGRSYAAIEKAMTMVSQENLAETPLRFFLCLPLAWVYYLRNDLQKAIDHAIMSQRCAEQAHYVTEVLGANFLLSLLYTAAGKPADADLFAGKLKSAVRTGAPGSVRLCEAFTAYSTIMQGDIRSAEKWADRRKPSAEDPFSICLIFECLACSRLLYLQGRYAACCRLLDAIKEKCVQRGILHGIVEIEVLRGAALHATGNRRLSRVAIGAILDTAEQEGYVRPFVDCWPLAPSFLVDVARSSASRYLAEILKACGHVGGLTAQEDDRAKGGLRPGLTPRETEILRLIALGYKKGEIAGRTFVSPDTVKTHTRHIFEKLDARTKAEAICRARQSGIID